MNLINHINKFTTVSEHDHADIMSYFKFIEVKKKQNLLVEGNICKSVYFVDTGCLRLFFIDDKGTERTIQFAIENWWLADFTSFASQTPSDLYIQAVEKSEILCLDFDSQEKLLQKYPQMERYFRLIHQRAHAASQFRIKMLYDLSSEAYFHLFNKHYPEFVQRVPQYLLASFLGFTPEYLSEIKNKKLS